MSAPYITIPVEKLPVFLTGPRAPLWWAMLLLITIEIAVFSTLITSYLYLRFTSPHWPPGEIEPPELALPLGNSVILLASSAAVLWADLGIKKGDVRRLKIGMGVALLLGVTFLVLKVVEYHDAAYRWDTHAYGSIVWAMILFHSMHVGAVVAKGFVMEVLAFRGYFDEKRHLGIDINGIYWHFVALVWIPLFIVIYLVPRW
jgi:cytochrome c oxidase subunit III